MQLDPVILAQIVAVAVGLGAVTKHLVPVFPNRFIPLITFLATVLLCAWSVNWDLSFGNTLAILVFAFAPTGVHQTARMAVGDGVTINGQTI